jgi:branched-chain amino acid transport system substrate-binding protein
VNARLRSVAAALATTFLLGAPSALFADSAPTGTPVEIHVVFSMTGFGAFLGASTQQALTAVETAVNGSGGIDGHPIKMVLHDDGSQPQQDVQLVNQLAAQHVPVIIGPGLVASCGAMTPLIAATGPVDICFSTGIHTDPGSYQFSMGVPSLDQLVAALHYMRQRGWKRFAVITPNDATGQDASRNIDTVFAYPDNKDLTITDRISFGAADSSVDAQIARIRNGNAQVVIAWATGTPFGTILHSMQNEGLNLPVLSSPGNVTYAAANAYAPLMPRETFFPSFTGVIPPATIDNPGVRREVAALRTAFAPTLPDIGAVPWDAGKIIVAAYKKYGLGLTSAQMRDFLSSLQYDGAFGNFNFRKYPQRGLSTESAVIVTYDRDKKTFVPVSKMGGDALR